MPKTIVIIPAYNEEETIASVISALHRAVPGFDIVVIDDGSHDRTASIVRKLDDVELVSMPYNVGIGAAMQTGFKFAYRNGYDIAIQCDADGQHPADQIERLVDRLEKGDADLVVGSRYVEDSEYTPSLFRRIGKSILSRFVNVVVGGGITDTTSGFRAVNRRALQMFCRHYPEDYPEAEALVIIHKSGLRAVEVAVHMDARQGGSTSIRPQHALYYMVKVGLAIFIDAFKRFTHAPGESA